jgi:fatty-acyl-CoA synthase
MVNLSSFIQFHALRTPDRVALIYSGQQLTYAELSDRIGRLAALLVERGAGPDTVIACVMKNSAAFIELAIAVSHVGAVFLPINFRLAREEIGYIVAHSDARLVFADFEFGAEVAGLSGVTLLDEPAQRDSRCLTATSRESPHTAVRAPDNLFRLMYTSGTTDRPKGVMHSYNNFYWKCMEHVVTLALSAEDRLLVAGPLYHVGAFDLPGIAVLWLGGTLCILRDFDAAGVLAAIEQERLTGVWLAPAMLNMVLAAAGGTRRDVSTLRWCIGGGEKTPESRIRAFSGVFPRARYIDAYGLTETCSGDTFMPAGMELTKIGSTGRPTPHLELEIRAADGTHVEPCIEGEICLRGPKVTKGYWRDPAKTAASFWGDWFRTGDIGYLDADGFLYITDRAKDMIISGGENIASSEVERVIYQLPQIREAAVVGIADPKWGERPVAVVVVDPAQSLDYASLAAHCRAHLAGFKVPDRLVLRDSLPRNPSGKVLKRVLREELSNTRRDSR